MELGLAGARACVTGGSRGLGRAVAELLAAEGAQVAVLGRDPDALADTLAALRARTGVRSGPDRTAPPRDEAGAPDGGAAESSSAGLPSGGSPTSSAARMATDASGEPVALVTDLTDAAAVHAAFDELGGRWGELNVLVNAAGPPTQRQRWYEIPDADWLDCYTLGVLGPLRAMRAALPLLRAARWARIVNVGAMSTRHPSAHRAAYTSAKAALATLTKQASIDLAPENILVNAVSPGAMLTDRLAARAGTTDPRAAMDWMREHGGFAAQTGRAGLPAEVARAVVHLAARTNTYVTGADLNADGGSLFR